MTDHIYRLVNITSGKAEQIVQSLRDKTGLTLAEIRGSTPCNPSFHTNKGG